MNPLRTLSVKAFCTIAPAIGVALGLAACGGGSSSGGGSHLIPTAPTTSAPSAYHISLSYIGGIAPRTSASAKRKRLDDSATPPPMLLVEPDSVVSFGTPMLLTGEAGANVGVVVSVSPMPSAPPTFQTTGNDVALATPPPNAQFQSLVVSNVANTTPTAASFTATVGSTSATAAVFTYPRINLGCSPNSPSANGTSAYQYVGGVKFVNGAAVAETDPAQSDIYISGPTCYGLFQSMEAENTMHFPGGGTTLDPTLAFNTFTAASWSNATTSETTASFTDGSTPISNVLSIQTIDPTPAVVTIWFGSEAAGGPNRGAASFSGGFKECGFTIDGSC